MTMRRPSRRAALAALIIGYLLHTVTALAVWRTWGTFGRGNVLAWIDFPVSLAYVHLDGGPLLLAEVHQLTRPLVAVDDRLRGDELHRHHPHAADPPDQKTEVAVRHPGHGSEPERGIDAIGADLHHRRGF